MTVQAYGVVPREVLTATDGLTFLRAMIAGEHPAPPIAQTLGFTLREVAEGAAWFEGVPSPAHMNPIGTVHAGFAATLLDSCVACAVHSTLKVGEGYTTLEFKLNLVRPILPTTGLVTAEGRIIHRGRTVATADGRLTDASGKLLAHATTTCQIFPAG